ncbi:ABC-type multidrug transport system permease subunit [Actinoalloteichus hoggarensis]|uniref:Transport permease protein n=1 Tax=Actinoalloteichus hoggarensis TaxID=1470176 RepID=A0A221W443_9PSEU|nr:ABC transporter permease [Actinoalloteichus hoggarensis]ASO20524.1 Daunorubicin/doxorubicin resistance ABC transporter permease protein DrrB [Actinoalloteichus hoggarensis]MBB5923564.1 ABC-type multidrug transport system permease subunit [Actinoalloteichus hoggarensis]
MTTPHTVDHRIAPAAGPVSRLRHAVTDIAAVTRRDLLHWAADPTPVIVNLLFPIMLVLMFGYLFGGAMTVPGGGDYREFLLPGMFAMTMLFGLESTVLAVTTDAARGVTDRFRSLPIAGSAVLGGRAVADLIDSTARLAVVMLCGLAVGWRWHGGLAAAAAAVALLLLLRLAFIWVGVYLGLLLRTPASAAAVQILVWPAGFLSNAFVAPETMPAPLAAAAEWNPMSATVTAARALFDNPGWEGQSFAAQHAVTMAVAWPLLLSAVFIPLALRRYRRLSR